MLDPNTNIITFPHVIPGTKLGGEDYTFNHIDGGMKKLADLGIESAYFLGGNVAAVGFVTKLGLYLCPNRWNNQIMAAYVHDPAQLTPLGKAALIERFPDCLVSFEPYRERTMSAEDIKLRDEVRRQAIEFGIAVEQVSALNANELIGLMKAVKSGVAEKKVASAEAPKEIPVNKHTEKVEHNEIGRRPKNMKI